MISDEGDGRLSWSGTSSFASVTIPMVLILHPPTTAKYATQYTLSRSIIYESLDILIFYKSVPAPKKRQDGFVQKFSDDVTACLDSLFVHI